MATDLLLQARNNVDQAKASLRAWGVQTDEQIRVELREHVDAMKASAVATARKSSIFAAVGALAAGVLAGRSVKKGKLPRLVSLASVIGIARTVVPLVRTVMARR